MWRRDINIKDEILVLERRLQFVVEEFLDEGPEGGDEVGEESVVVLVALAHAEEGA